MEWVIFRIQDHLSTRKKLARTSEWYPRIVEATTPERAIERMFEDETGELKVAGERRFLVVPLNAAAVVNVKPKREFDYYVGVYPGFENL